MDWTGLATLVAAVTAALLSAASLFFSGRREDRRWKREVLVETMVSLFDASFNSIDKATFEARESGKNLEWHRERALHAHALELQALTRLRFLARPEVVERAFELHHIENALYEGVFKTPLDGAELAKLGDERRIARTKLFNACRRNLGLRRTLPVSAPGTVGPTAQEFAEHEMRHKLEGETDTRPAPGKRRSGGP